MLKNDLSQLTTEEYEELKEYLKLIYDIDSVFLNPIIFSPDLTIC